MAAPHCSVAAELLSLGAILEPLAHPKPGGVTRCSPWKGSTIHDYALARSAVRIGLEEACAAGCVQGCLAAALRRYLEWLRRLGIAGNPNLGTMLLLAPLACTWPQPGPEAHARSASACARGLGAADAHAYYKALEALSPSHLGTYEGPVPAVGSGEYPGSMLEVLRAAAWDHVHGELLKGYPLTLEALEWIRREGPGEDSVVVLVLRLIARHGDTLIARSRGWRAMLRAMEDARIALSLIRRGAPVRLVVEAVRREWAGRGWNPGAVLDIVAAALGLYYLHEGASRGG